MSLDVSNWKSFLVSDIFNIKNGKGITQNEIIENPGELIAVQSGENNNGVMGKIDKDYCKSRDYIYTEKSCLTVARSGTAGFVSFQKSGCVVGDSAKILELKNEKYSSEGVLLFLQTLLLANRYKFNYGYKVTTKKYSDIVLELPVDDNNEPDWNFMEGYVKSLSYKKITTKNVNFDTNRLNTNNWKDFNMGELFDSIKKGNKYNKDELEEVNVSENYIKYITRTAENNGCEWFAADLHYDGLEAGNAITVGDTTATCFYQGDDFICGDHMVVLRADWLNKYTGLFIVTLLKNEQYKYNYGRAFKLDMIKSTILKLPVCSDGSPDWKFMENYIKSLPYGDRI